MLNINQNSTLKTLFSRKMKYDKTNEEKMKHELENEANTKTQKIERNVRK